VCARQTHRHSTVQAEGKQHHAPNIAWIVKPSPTLYIFCGEGNERLGQQNQQTKKHRPWQPEQTVVLQRCQTPYFNPAKVSHFFVNVFT